MRCFRWAARCLSRPQERPLLQRLLSAPRRGTQPLRVPHPAVRAHPSVLAPRALGPNKLRVLARCTKDVTLCSALSPRLLLNSQEFAHCIEMQLIREVFADGR